MPRALRDDRVLGLTLALALTLVSLVPAAAGEPGGGGETPDLQAVSAGVFRGSQPDLAAFPVIAARGIRTIVSLRAGERSAAERAAAEAKRHGLGWWQRGMRQYIGDSCGATLVPAAQRVDPP